MCLYRKPTKSPGILAGFGTTVTEIPWLVKISTHRGTWRDYDQALSWSGGSTTGSDLELCSGMGVDGLDVFCKADLAM